MDTPQYAEAFERLRPELTAFLARMVLRPALAEELAQETGLRMLEAKERAPADAGELRPWLFRVASNLAIDHLRRHSQKNETLLFDLREAAESDPDFMASAQALVGQPEMRAVAREHLVACFACVLGSLPPQKAAALLLVEAHGFTIDEAAAVMDARPAQTKNWLQEARQQMREHYDRSCALVAKEGICHQCAELASFFTADTPPAMSPATHFAMRLEALHELRTTAAGPWQERLFSLLDELD